MVKPTGQCKPMCTYFKGKFAEDVKLIKKEWISTKEGLLKLCRTDDENSLKVFSFSKIFIDIIFFTLAIPLDFLH